MSCTINLAQNPCLWIDRPIIILLKANDNKLTTIDILLYSQISVSLNPHQRSFTLQWMINTETHTCHGPEHKRLQNSALNGTSKSKPLPTGLRDHF